MLAFLEMMRLEPEMVPTTSSFALGVVVPMPKEPSAYDVPFMIVRVFPERVARVEILPTLRIAPETDRLFISFKAEPEMVPATWKEPFV